MHEDAAAYALTALDGADLAEYEAHLATCEVCQREVAEFSETAAALSLLTQATPPPSLRSNVLTVIQSVPQLPAENPTDEGPGMPAAPSRPRSTDTRTRATGPRRAHPDSEISDELDTQRGDELEVRRLQRRNRILRGLVAALLIITVGVGGVIYTVVQQRQARGRCTGRLPGAAAPRGGPPGRGGADSPGWWPLHVHGLPGKLNRALYLGTGMPDPGHGRHYQLWTATGTVSKPVPALDNAVPNVRPWRQYFGGNVAQADLLAVSIEPDGTTPVAPTPNQIVVLAELPPA